MDPFVVVDVADVEVGAVDDDDVLVVVVVACLLFVVLLLLLVVLLLPPPLELLSRSLDDELDDDA